jgi:hypothetical protein
LMGLTWIYIVKLVIMLVHLTTQRDHTCVNARRSLHESCFEASSSQPGVWDAQAGGQADDAMGKWSWAGSSWEGWVPGMSQQSAKARHYHRDARWEAHLANKLKGTPSTRVRPYGKECPSCDDNLRKSDCDYGLCGKCCGLTHKYDACAAHRPWL